jgi:PPOX class probable F420-dependent enzyme
MASTIDSEARAFLEQPYHAHVATLRHDGSVHAVVVWQDPEGERLTLNTAEGRAWRNNVKRDPRVTVTVIDPENAFHWVSVRGRVVEDTHDGADEHIDRLAKKYLDADTYPFRSPTEQRVRIVVEPEHVTHYTGA